MACGKNFAHAKQIVKKQRRKRNAQLTDQDYGLVQHIADKMHKAYEVYGQDKYGKHITYNAYEDAGEAYEHLGTLRKTYRDGVFGIRPVAGKGKKKIIGRFKKSIETCAEILEDKADAGDGDVSLSDNAE